MLSNVQIALDSGKFPNSPRTGRGRAEQLRRHTAVSSKQSALRAALLRRVVAGAGIGALPLGIHCGATIARAPRNDESGLGQATYLGDRNLTVHPRLRPLTAAFYRALAHYGACRFLGVRGAADRA